MTGMRIKGLFLGLLLALGACTGKPDGVQPVRGFEATRYLGVWYEVMRLDHSFERDLTRVSATYTARPDGSIGVLNRGFDPKNCRWKDAEGHAVFQGPPDVGSLSVTFFWPFAGGYHVVDLDHVGYQWALVSGPSRSYLWMLARRADLDPAIRARLVEKARGLGFPVGELILVDHAEKPAGC
jgi:apolipoprotein D and lipocalin family protein